MIVFLVVGGLLAGALAWLFSPPGLQALGNFLVIRDPLVPVDAVIAISGGGAERVRTASALVKEGIGRWLIVSGSTGGAAPGGATAAMARLALWEGVPADRILVDDASNSTLDNARHSATLMEGRHLRSAIVVTSPYHTRRAALLFRAEFCRRGLAVRVMAERDSFFEMRDWWTRPLDRGLVLREYMKLAALLVGIR